MNNYIILEKRKYIKKVKENIKKLNMKLKLKNTRTAIWNNQDIQISIDKTIIRILIYSKKDIDYYSKIFLSKCGK